MFLSTVCDFFLIDLVRCRLEHKKAINELLARSFSSLFRCSYYLRSAPTLWVFKNGMDGWEEILKGWEMGMGHMKNGKEGEKGKEKERKMEGGVNDHVVQRQLMKGGCSVLKKVCL